jgi:glutamine synthetase
MRNDRHLSVEDLTARIDSGDVDTVVVAFTDMQGRLQGKRLHGAYFRDEVIGHGTEGCNYLLGVDIDMNTVEGYAITSWDKGYGDMEFVMDLDTIRLLTHLPATAMVQCDLAWPDRSPVLQSPRTILKQQMVRAAKLGFTAFAGTELEFIVFEDTYEAAFEARYQGLTPANQYNVDYSIVGGTRVEPLLRDIRNTMYSAGMNVEGSKGECNFGQHEIGFVYDDALVTADNHAVYKTAAKEIAALHGKSLTFMAKYDQREGNSCHIHLSLRGIDGSVVFWDDGAGKRTALYDHFVAGVLATMPDLTLLYAPNINSYKRFVEGSFAPTAVAWGMDNRTCALRVVGHGHGMRMECRAPGGDVNQYLAVSALIAGGLHGIDQGLELPAACEGNAYTSGAERLPTTMAEAAALFEASTVAREAFGDEVVEHYLNNAKVELKAFNSTVTDWERRRGFERL